MKSSYFVGRSVRNGPPRQMGLISKLPVILGLFSAISHIHAGHCMDQIGRAGTYRAHSMVETTMLQVLLQNCSDDRKSLH
jgi:hypothetical protein